jgi:hypothetical protein
MDGKREWKEYLESICDKIVEFQKNSHDWKYMMKKELGLKGNLSTVVYFSGIFFE